MNIKKKLEYIINENGCIICISHFKNKDGYVLINVDGKTKSLHRHTYELVYGEIPEGLVIRHKCDNPTCFNIEHLEVGTNYDNVRDRVERGRGLKGEGHPNARLTWEQVNNIRNNNDLSNNKLAKKYNVSAMTISKIKRNILWKIT
jgi:hypothetical protein